MLLYIRGVHRNNSFSELIWKIEKPTHIFVPVLTISLIKKGRGTWPDEALATPQDNTPGTGANSISAQAGVDKSDAKV